METLAMSALFARIKSFLGFSGLGFRPGVPTQRAASRVEQLIGQINGLVAANPETNGTSDSDETTAQVAQLTQELVARTSAEFHTLQAGKDAIRAAEDAWARLKPELANGGTLERVSQLGNALFASARREAIHSGCDVAAARLVDKLNTGIPPAAAIAELNDALATLRNGLGLWQLAHSLTTALSALTCDDEVVASVRKRLLNELREIVGETGDAESPLNEVRRAETLLFDAARLRQIADKLAIALQPIDWQAYFSKNSSTITAQGAALFVAVCTVIDMTVLGAASLRVGNWLPLSYFSFASGNGGLAATILGTIAFAFASLLFLRGLRKRALPLLLSNPAAPERISVLDGNKTPPLGSIVASSVAVLVVAFLIATVYSAGTLWRSLGPPAVQLTESAAAKFKFACLDGIYLASLNNRGLFIIDKGIDRRVIQIEPSDIEFFRTDACVSPPPKVASHTPQDSVTDALVALKDFIEKDSQPALRECLDATKVVNGKLMEMVESNTRRKYPPVEITMKMPSPAPADTHIATAISKSDQALRRSTDAITMIANKETCDTVRAQTQNELSSAESQLMFCAARFANEGRGKSFGDFIWRNRPGLADFCQKEEGEIQRLLAKTSSAGSCNALARGDIDPDTLAAMRSQSVIATPAPQQ
jgi:hypothetical protein